MLPLIRRRALVGLGLVLGPLSAFALSGTVFRDYDSDNSKDALEPLAAGVTVTAYGNANSNCGATITAPTGSPNFTLNPSNAGNCAVATYRVEFTGGPSGASPTTGAGGVNSNVQFLDALASGVVQAIRTGGDYCLAPGGTTGLRVATTQMRRGDQSSATNYTAFDFDYNAIGNFNTAGYATAATELQTGTTYGAAWQRKSRNLFLGAYMKRHADDNNGLGKIYRTARNATNTGWAGAPGTYVDLEALFPGSAGTDPRVEPYDYVADTLIWDQVGKSGLGDLEMSDDDQTLYAVALGDRKLYQIPANSPTQITNPAAIASNSIPRPSSCAVDGDFRPFALSVEDGDVYVGAVCTGQSTATTGSTCRINGDRRLLRAYVLRFTPGVGFDAAPVMDFPLNYPRLDADPNQSCTPDGDPSTPGVQPFGNAFWAVWTASLSDTPFYANGQVYPNRCSRVSNLTAGIWCSVFGIDSLTKVATTRVADCARSLRAKPCAPASKAMAVTYWKQTAAAPGSMAR